MLVKHCTSMFSMLFQGLKNDSAVEKEIDDMLEDDDKYKFKYIMCNIFNAILTQNLEI